MKTTQSKYWLRSGTYSILNNLTNLVFGFGGFLILIRILSKDEFGTWALYLGLTVLLDMARNGLIQNAFIKYSVNAAKEEYAKIFTASISLNGLITILLIAALFIIARPLSILWQAPILENLLYVFSITSIVSMFLSQFDFVMQSEGNFKGIFLANLVKQSLFFAGISLMVITLPKIELVYLVILQTFCAVSGVAISYRFVKKNINFTNKWEWLWIKKLFNYGKYVFGTSVSSIVLNNIDNMMLGYLIGVRAVAVYNTAFRISNFIEVPIGSVAAIVFPKSAQRMQTDGKNAIKYLYERSVGAILAIVLPMSLLILIFARQTITIIAGHEYLDSVVILQIIIAFSFLKPFLRMFGTTLGSIGKPHVNFYVILFSVIINAISNYIFIIHFGLIGAALGTLSTLLLCVIFSKIILARELNIKMMNTIVYAMQFYTETFKMGISFCKEHFSICNRTKHNNYAGE